jgi:hypothetical protein
MLLGPLLQQANPQKTRLFGIEEQLLLTFLILGGIGVSALFLILGQATAASFGIVATLGGIDCVIQSRETHSAMAI